jgi:two-component system, cell cycle response regulator DivK
MNMHDDNKMTPKVLIIDDEPRNILALVATLRARGFICLTATTAQEGIAVLGAESGVGIVLMDMMMPEMDGYRAIPEFKQRFDLPVVAVTAQAMLGDRERCLEAGADEYIAKPINVDRLLEILNKWIKK